MPQAGKYNHQPVRLLIPSRHYADADAVSFSTKLLLAKMAFF